MDFVVSGFSRTVIASGVRLQPDCRGVRLQPDLARVMTMNPHWGGLAGGSERVVITRGILVVSGFRRYALL